MRNIKSIDFLFVSNYDAYILIRSNFLEAGRQIWTKDAKFMAMRSDMRGAKSLPPGPVEEFRNWPVLIDYI